MAHMEIISLLKCYKRGDRHIIVLGWTPLLLLIAGVLFISGISNGDHYVVTKLFLLWRDGANWVPISATIIIALWFAMKITKGRVKVKKLYDDAIQVVETGNPKQGIIKLDSIAKGKNSSRRWRYYCNLTMCDGEKSNRLKIVLHNVPRVLRLSEGATNEFVGLVWISNDHSLPIIVKVEADSIPVIPYKVRQCKD